MLKNLGILSLLLIILYSLEKKKLFYLNEMNNYVDLIITNFNHSLEYDIIGKLIYDYFFNIEQ